MASDDVDIKTRFDDTYRSLVQLPLPIREKIKDEHIGRIIMPIKVRKSHDIWCIRDSTGEHVISYYWK